MFRIAWNQFKDWLFDTKQSIWLIIIVFIYQWIASPLLNNSQLMNEKLGIFEPFIALANNNILQLIIPITFLFLISGFPRRYSYSCGQLTRMGRERWLYSQLTFLLFCSIFCTLMTLIITILCCLGRIEFTTSWSKVITDFKNVFPELQQNAGVKLLEENIYYQMHTIPAFLLSLFFMVLNLWFYGFLLVTGYCINLENLSYVITVIIISISFAMCIANSKLKWIFRGAHGILGLHFTHYYRKPILNPLVSLLYFVIIITILFILDLCMIKKKNMYGERT